MLHFFYFCFQVVCSRKKSKIRSTWAKNLNLNQSPSNTFIFLTNITDESLAPSCTFVEAVTPLRVLEFHVASVKAKAVTVSTSVQLGAKLSSILILIECTPLFIAKCRSLPPASTDTG